MKQKKIINVVMMFQTEEAIGWRELKTEEGLNNAALIIFSPKLIPDSYFVISCFCGHLKVPNIFFNGYHNIQSEQKVPVRLNKLKNNR